jgi:hypothetical protein
MELPLSSIRIGLIAGSPAANASAIQGLILPPLTGIVSVCGGCRRLATALVAVNARGAEPFARGSAGKYAASAACKFQRGTVTACLAQS